MMKRSTLVLAITLFGTHMAVASNLSDSQLSGADVVDSCTNQSDRQVGYCQGYIQAVFDSFRAEDPICPPTRISRQTIIRAVLDEISDSPTGIQDNAYDAVKAALLSSYPCR